MEVSARQLEIIKSAGEIITEGGIAGLTTKKIAARVGFSEAAIYRHFKGKDAIVLALLSYLANNMAERFKVIDPFLEPEDYVKAVFASQSSFFSSNPHFVVAVFSEGLMVDNQAINKKVQQIIAIKQNMLLPIIESGQQKGVFTKIVSEDALAHMMIGAFRFQMYNWLISQFQFDVVAANNKIVNEILKLIKTK